MFLLGLVYQEGAPGIGLIAEIVDEVALIDGLGVKVDGVEHNLRAEPLDTYVHIGAGKLDWTRSRTVFVVKPELLEKMVSGNRVLVQLRTTRKGTLTGDFSKGCQTARGTPCGTIREFLKDKIATELAKHTEARKGRKHVAHTSVRENREPPPHYPE